MIELLKGSFSGAKFNFQESTWKFGNKIAVHKYINSDKTDFEVMGKDVETESILIYTHGIGAKYFSEVNALESKFKQKAEGVFVHPIKGSKFVVIQSVERIEKITELGKASFRIVYYIDTSRGIGVLARGGAAQSFSGGAAQDFLPSIGPTSGSISNASNQINKIGSEFVNETIINDSVLTWSSISENIDLVVDFAKKAQVFVNKAQDYAELSVKIANFDRSALLSFGTIGTSLFELFNVIDNTIDSAINTYDLFTQLFNYGDDRVDINPTTKQLQSELTNEIAFRDYMQTTALTKATDSITRIDFPTQNDLELKLQVVLDQFEKVQAFDSTSSDLYNDLQKQKVDLIGFVTGIKQTLPRIKNVNVVNESLSTLVYRFYGNNDNYETIRDLNGFTEPSVINGEVKVISNG